MARKEADAARERSAASRGAPAPLPGGRCGERLAGGRSKGRATFCPRPGGLGSPRSLAEPHPEWKRRPFLRGGRRGCLGRKSLSAFLLSASLLRILATPAGVRRPCFFPGLDAGLAPLGWRRSRRRWQVRPASLRPLLGRGQASAGAKPPSGVGGDTFHCLLPKACSGSRASVSPKRLKLRSPGPEAPDWSPEGAALCAAGRKKRVAFPALRDKLAPVQIRRLAGPIRALASLARRRLGKKKSCRFISLHFCKGTISRDPMEIDESGNKVGRR